MPTGRRIIPILILFSWPLLLMHFFRFVPSIIAVPLSEQFGLTGLHMGWFSAAFFYSYSLLQIPAGAMVDRFGARVVLAVGMGLAGIASLLMAWDAFAFSGIMVLRTLAGVGMGVAFTCRVVVLARAYPGPGFAQAFGIIQGVQNLLVLSFTTPLALLVAATSWRFPHALVGLLLLVVALTVFFGARAPATEPLEPVVCAKTGLGSTVRPSFWTGLRTVIGTAATWPALAVILGMYTPVLAFSGSWGVPFLRQTFGLDDAAASSFLLLAVLGTIVFSPVAGWLSDTVLLRRRLPILLGASVACASWLYLLWAHERVSPVTFGVLLVVISGATAFFALGMAVVKEVNSPRVAGVALGVSNMAAFVGAALAQPAIGWVTDSSYRGAFAITLLFALVGVWGAWRITETNCHNIGDNAADDRAALEYVHARR